MGQGSVCPSRAARVLAIGPRAAVARCLFRHQGGYGGGPIRALPADRAAVELLDPAQKFHLGYLMSGVEVKHA
jgi:hypothetical protein